MMNAQYYLDKITTDNKDTFQHRDVYHLYKAIGALIKEIEMLKKMVKLKPLYCDKCGNKVIVKEDEFYCPFCKKTVENPTDIPF
jgi:rubrerythrin